MSDLSKHFLRDLNFRTALLESVDWDETRSASLLQYLQESLSKLHGLPEDILEHVKLEYGESAYVLINKIFVEAYIENGLYKKAEDDYEH